MDSVETDVAALGRCNGMDELDRGGGYVKLVYHHKGENHHLVISEGCAKDLIDQLRAALDQNPEGWVRGNYELDREFLQQLLDRNPDCWRFYAKSNDNVLSIWPSDQKGKPNRTIRMLRPDPNDPMGITP